MERWICAGNLHYEKFADGTVKCIEDEIPFEVPEGWEWARIASVSSIVTDGEHKTPHRCENYSGYYLLSARNIQNSFLLLDNVDYVDREEYSRISKRCNPKRNDVLISCSGSVGRVAVVEDDNHYVMVRSAAMIRFINLNPYFGMYALQSLFLQLQIQKSSKQTAQANLFQGAILNLLLPIPPFKAQREIAKKVSGLFKDIHEIENEKIIIDDLLKRTKAKILDMAIRGKLVPQNPDDEPASALLKRIRAKKKELVKQGKIKRDKKESIIFKGEDNSYYIRKSARTEPIDEQFIFELPDNWEWCSLPNIARVELGKTLDRAKNTGVNHPYLRSINVYWNKVDLTDLNEMRFEPEELERYTIRRNDLLICEGGDVGRSCVWTAENEIQYQNALHRVRFYGGCNPFYFMYYMMYYESRGIIKSLCKGVTIKHLTGNILSLIPFALPPLEEQNHIVKQLKQIFSLLDSILCK